MSIIPGIEAPAPKAFRNGTHRFIAPEETIERARPFLPVMGITRIANVTGLDSIGVPVVMVCRPNSWSLSVSQGKGLTLAAAKASGLFESIETYHAERVTLPLKLASLEDLRYTHRVVDVMQLPRSATSAYHPHLPILWIEGYDILQQEGIWVPFAVVHCNYCLPIPVSMGCLPVTTDGLASGNHLLEAISHAICELVERDAVTLWELRGSSEKARTRLNLSTVDDAGCCEVLERCARAGVDVAVWDATSDVEMPTFVCWIVDQPATDPMRLLYACAGWGTHPTRQIALLRALTEAVQSRLTFISGARDDMFHSQYEEQRQRDTIEYHRLQMATSMPMRDFHDVPSFETETFDEDVGWELARLHGAGIERVIVVNLTKPEFRIPVVRVVIPGLESVAGDIPDYLLGPRARAVLEGK